MATTALSAAKRRRTRAGERTPGDKAAAWAAPVLAMLAILAVAPPPAGAGGPPSPAQAAGQTQAPKGGWIGMPRGELFKKLGRPSQIVEFPDTGGQMIIYAHPGKRHYVFEIGPTDKVGKAAEVK